MATELAGTVERSRVIRRLKWLMRPLPRRANIHRYPVLKWFAAVSRKRSYLWSFRESRAIPAIYVGCVLSLLPVYGVQLLSAALLAFGLRLNLMILAGLQLITNPLTVIPLYGLACYIGLRTFLLFGLMEVPGGSPEALASLMGTHLKAVVLALMGQGDTSASLAGLNEATGMNLMEFALLGLQTCCVGAVVMGLLLAFVLSGLYRWFIHLHPMEHRLLKGLANAPTSETPDPRG